MIHGSRGRTQISPILPAGSGWSSSSTMMISASPRPFPADEPFATGSHGVKTVTGKVSVIA